MKLSSEYLELDQNLKKVECEVGALAFQKQPLDNAVAVLTYSALISIETMAWDYLKTLNSKFEKEKKRISDPDDQEKKEKEMTREALLWIAILGRVSSTKDQLAHIPSI